MKHTFNTINGFAFLSINLLNSLRYTGAKERSGYFIRQKLDRIDLPLEYPSPRLTSLRINVTFLLLLGRIR